MPSFLKNLADRLTTLWDKVTAYPTTKKIDSSPAAHFLRRWFGKFRRFVRVPFNTPHFMGFEIVWMRILFAIAVFQTMPLGGTWANWAYLELREAKAHWFENGRITEEADLAFRPPFLPVMEMLPISDGAMSDTKLKQPNGFANLAPAGDAKPGFFTSIRKIFDFTYFSDPDFVKMLPWLVMPALLLYASGVGLPIALPILVWVSIGSRTLFNSQGATHHGFQMLTMVLVAQMCVVFWHCKKDWHEAFGFRKARARNGITFWDQFIRYAQIMIVACYVIAGVIKPIKSDGEWFANSHMIGIQLVKTDRQNYYNDLDDVNFNREPVPYAKDMMEHANVSRIFMAMGVLLEIFAFVALFSRSMGLVMGFLFISFHYFNEFLMKLYFYNNEKLVWIFLINIPFWIWWIWQKLRRKRASDMLLAEVEVEPVA
ncbi:hypothetical protein OAE61_02070 [Verrucomicrobiales bacterium]|mgnify:CR=1 FL=1|nr:hypothetical protein [Verrucomicrobiales bacterium]